MATKKETVEITVEEKLKRLFSLQQLLSRIDEIRTLRGELPMEVQDLEDEIEGLNTRLDAIQNTIEDQEENIKSLTASAAAAQVNIARYNEQLKNVSNNREYENLEKEIEYNTLEGELCEKKIREAKKLIDSKRAEMAHCAAEASENRAHLDLKKSELDEIIAENKAEEDKLHEKALNIEAGIETRLLTAFKRIRKNSRNGLGVVYVNRDACGGCFNKIPPQRQLDIRMRKKVIVCEYCGRILIDPELAGIEVQTKKVEEKKKRIGTRRKKSDDATESAD